MSDTTERRTAILARLAAATPEPWHYTGSTWVMDKKKKPIAAFNFGAAEMGNIDLIAHAPDDLRWYDAALTLAEGAMTAQDEREAQAGMRCSVPVELSGCDWPDAVAEEVLMLRAKLTQTEQERDKLKRLVDEEHQLGKDILETLAVTRRDLKQTEQALAGLVAALKRYGIHDDTCESAIGAGLKQVYGAERVDGKPWKCECGLDAALSAGTP